VDSLITAAARALAAGDPLGALKRVALRDDAPALALRGIAMAQLGDLVRAMARVRSAARIAYCKALALEPNPAGRRWLERKAALLVTP
jgi:predicted RNA polymerase sigma factor